MTEGPKRLRTTSGYANTQVTKFNTRLHGVAYPISGGGGRLRHVKNVPHIPKLS